MQEIKTDKPEVKKVVDKDFWLTSFSLSNKNSVYFLTFLIVIMGILTYMELPKDSYPEITQPTVYIGTSYPGNTPIDIENLVTRHIEKKINTITEVEEISSTSVQDYSTIIVKFDSKTDVEEAIQKAKDAVDNTKADLPNDLPQDPNVFEMNISEFPILNINLSGPYDLMQLEEYAETIQDELEKITEISKVDILGVDERVVHILLDPYKMQAREVSFNDVAKAVSEENVTFSGGNILSDGIRRSIRIVGEFEEAKDINDIVVKSEKGNITYLYDLGEVKFGFDDRESYARLANQTVVSLDIVKRSGENMLITVEKINKVLDEFKETLPKSLVIVTTNDQSSFVKEMVSNLENSIIMGMILVVGVLLFFLGTKNALFVGIAIPLSMFIVFNVLGFFGITVNMMILFSLILALGMLVDNGIVVVENTYRLMEEGYSPIEATRKGIGEVATPIIASTATTLAAFLPLALWPGLMGEFMQYLPIGVMITLTSSLFVALVLNPVFISNLMTVSKGDRIINHKKVLRNTAILVAVAIFFFVIGSNFIANLVLFIAFIIPTDLYFLSRLTEKFQSKFLPILERTYASILTFALKGKRPYLFFLGTVGLLFLCFVLMSVFPPKVIFFPVNQPKYVNVFVEFPVGTDIETTNKFTKNVEKEVAEIVKPYNFLVESIITKVGEGTADPGDLSAFSQSSTTPHKARITINFVEYQYRKKPETQEIVNTTEILEKVRKGVSQHPGVSITVDKDNNGPPTGKPISIEITGLEFDELVKISGDFKRIINQSGIKGIEKLKSSLDVGKPELIVDIDREKARRYQLSTSMIADEIRTSLFGKEISKYKLGEDEYDIKIHLEDVYRYDLDALMNKDVIFRNQSDGKIYKIPIASVASTRLSSTYSSVKRKDLKRLVELSSNVLNDYNPTEINSKLKELLSSYEMPPGYSFRFGGEQEKQAEEMAFLQKALLIAIFLIFIIIIAQFNKITTPVIIMVTVILSTIGVFLGLIAFNMDFVVIMTMIGIISLAGVVVNNAIVLIDFIELSRKRKLIKSGLKHLPFEEVVNSIVEAGKTRLRPVLLTAITTIFGLIPLAFGINIDFFKLLSTYDPNYYLGGDNTAFWGPMSWTIIFGLVFATFLTLVIVPVMYWIVSKVDYKLTNRHAPPIR